MTSSPTLPAQSTDTGLYLEVQQFYAHQMQLLDDRACDEWAATFTPEGVFAANGLPAPAKGRQTIAAAARAAGERLAAEGLVHRHWLGMLTVLPQPDGTVSARSYALVIQTRIGGGGTAELHRSTLCEDRLVRGEDGSLLVLERKVTRDDLA
ncbi:nuclear transport factor 2 family protein [Streptomyces sp. NPDC013178]|uniref:nuclear transport factor 2 family protein n=1 Tax=Streptomyces sp. NPDC013178 TaxID=3155118 RepID=UPI0033C0E5B1